MALWKKQSQIEEMIAEYLAESDQCVRASGEAFDEYLESGPSEAFHEKVKAVQEAEWSADQKRRQVEEEMFDKALMPALRGDLLSLLEALDAVPNECEEVIREIWLRSVHLPEEYHDRLQDLVRVNIEANERLGELVRQLFEAPADVVPVADKVVEAEKAADVIEQELVKAIFDSPRELAEKMLLAHVVNGIAEISDLAEDASDMVRVIAVKQQA